MYPRRAQNAGRDGARGAGLDRPRIRSTDDVVCDDVSLEVRKGEILGIAGLMGAGRTELVMSLFGAWGKREAGELRLGGEKVDIRSAQRRHRLGGGAGLRGPEALRAGAGHGREGELHAGQPAADRAARRHRQERGDQAGRPLRQGAAHQDAVARAAGGQPLGRQPAEGRARQVAADPAEGPLPRRADAWHRRGRQGRDLQHHERPRGPGGLRGHGLVRAPRGAGDERPDRWSFTRGTSPAPCRAPRRRRSGDALTRRGRRRARIGRWNRIGVPGGRDGDDGERGSGGAAASARSSSARSSATPSSTRCSSRWWPSGSSSPS